MLTKDQFCKLFCTATESYCMVNNVCNILEISETRLFDASYQLFEFLVEEMEDDEVMKEKFQGKSIIMTFVFDYRFGTAIGDGEYLCDVNGKRYTPTTVEELYDCLVEFYQKEGNK